MAARVVDCVRLLLADVTLSSPFLAGRATQATEHAQVTRLCVARARRRADAHGRRAVASRIQVPLPYGLVLYEDDARSASEHRVIMRVVDTKTQLDARAYEAAALTDAGRRQQSELWSERPVVNEATRIVSFGVRYHRTPGDAPVDVVVACERIMKIDAELWRDSAVGIYPSAPRQRPTGAPRACRRGPSASPTVASDPFFAAIWG